MADLQMVAMNTEWTTIPMALLEIQRFRHPKLISAGTGSRRRRFEVHFPFHAKTQPIGFS